MHLFNNKSVKIKVTRWYFAVLKKFRFTGYTVNFTNVLPETYSETVLWIKYAATSRIQTGNL